MGKITKNLTQKQKKAIKLLISKGYAYTLEELEISDSLLNKWLEDSEFIKGFNKEIARITREADNIMKINAKAAVSSICELSQKASSESVRFQASKEIIAYIKAAENARTGENGQIAKLIEGLRELEEGGAANEENGVHQKTGGAFEALEDGEA